MDLYKVIRRIMQVRMLIENFVQVPIYAQVAAIVHNS